MSVHEYEVTFIVNPTLNEDDTVGIVERVTQQIANRAGAIKDVSPWGKRRLAYPINHLREGSYVTTTFSMDSERENELEGAINLIEPVIRHLIVRVNETQKAKAQRARTAAQRAAAPHPVATFAAPPQVMAQPAEARLAAPAALPDEDAEITTVASPAVAEAGVPAPVADAPVADAPVADTTAELSDVPTPAAATTAVTETADVVPPAADTAAIEEE